MKFMAQNLKSYFIITALVGISFVTANSNASDNEYLTIFCKTSSHGVCTSDGDCTSANPPFEDYKLKLIKLPEVNENADATIYQCRGSACPNERKTSVRGLVWSYEISTSGETFKIDKGSGRFARSVTASNPSQARVHHVFGTCILP